MIAVKKSRARSADRKPENPKVANEARTAPLAPAVRGWVEGAALSEQDGLFAAVNVFPTTRGVRVRGGCYKVADIGDPVTSIFAYRSSASVNLFAASETAIYDVTGLDPDTIPAADVSSQTGGLYSAAMMGTTAGEYLYVVNGADKAQLFDGTTWAEIDDLSTPAIDAVDTSDLRYVWKHKNRLWFIEAGTKTAWYLPVDSIGGTAADFSLDGVFQLGGSLLFGATWSQDSGDGMDDRCVFVSDQGEVAVYAGTNPASASDWAMVGLYRMPPPLGQDAHIKAGGDIVVATDGGLIPLSAVIEKDPSVLELSAASQSIRPSWTVQARNALSSKPWQVVKWPREQMIAVIIPTSSREMFVSNSATGAWGKYTGWDAQCATIFNRIMYFGSEDGAIYQAERGGSDNGVPFTSSWAYAPQSLSAAGVTKICNAARATFSAGTVFHPQITTSVDYSVQFPPPPNAALDPTKEGSIWDTGLWDIARWDVNALDVNEVPVITTGWVSQGGVGDTIIPQFQITTDSENRPVVEMLSADILYEIGSPVG